jgi:hypothetical protein
MLPVASAQVGWVIAPITGIDGAPGYGTITTSADGGEIHPASLVTVKLYVPAASPDIVVAAPVPGIAPGLIVQLPAGKPLNITLPVANAHVGSLIVPSNGLAGIPVGVLITTEDEASEVQPDAIVTVKLYVPGTRFEIIVDVPDPEIAPGLIVQTPTAGRPLITTLPVIEVHDDGCVIAPIAGAAGDPGGEMIITSVEGRDIHPASLVILKLYVPGIRLAIIVLVPVPVIAPGLMIQVPVAGNPFKITLPVGVPHEEGCVIVPAIGAVGAAGGAFTTTLADAFDIHPVAAVTLKL